jgi:hypothetical protein
MNADNGHQVGAHCVRPYLVPICVYLRGSAFICVRLCSYPLPTSTGTFASASASRAMTLRLRP